MVTTKQKSVIDTQKLNRKESKHTTTENHQITKRAREERNKGIIEQPENNEQNGIVYVHHRASIRLFNCIHDSSNLDSVQMPIHTTGK